MRFDLFLSYVLRLEIKISSDSATGQKHQLAVASVSDGEKPPGTIPKLLRGTHGRSLIKGGLT